jgi:hypothetical protein
MKHKEIGALFFALLALAFVVFIFILGSCYQKIWCWICVLVLPILWLSSISKGIDTTMNSPPIDTSNTQQFVDESLKG